MLLEEYDEKAEREYLRKEAIEEGLERGIEQGIEQGMKLGIEQGIEQGMKLGIEQGIEQGMILGSFEILAELVDKSILSLEKAEEQLKDKKEEFIRWYQEQR